MIITAKDIREQMQKEFAFDYVCNFDKLMFSDGSYFMPAKEWYEKEFFTWYKMQLKHYHVSDYETSWDCDKYSSAFQVFANICHAQNEPHKSESIAVAEVHYTTRTGESHAINAVLVNDNEMLFIEPQVPEFIELTYDEMRSIRFMKF